MPSELTTIKALMGETENIDEFKRSLVATDLEAGNPIAKIGSSGKHLPVRQEFSIGGVKASKESATATRR